MGQGCEECGDNGGTVEFYRKSKRRLCLSCAQKKEAEGKLPAEDITALEDLSNELLWELR